MIASRVAAVRERIARAAARAGRAPDDVTLIAVSKTQPADVVREAFAAGLRHFGENKVQEAEDKIAALADLRTAGLVWHMIGHVQSNKGRRAAELFHAVDSGDDATLAKRPERGEEAPRSSCLCWSRWTSARSHQVRPRRGALFPALEQLRG